MKLKKKEVALLKAKAKEIREQIIDATSKNGGHLSANLGVVELTMAIHKIFDLPNDTLIFDVSHQCYTHKILSGRSLDEMGKLNETSGFMKPSESPFDKYSLGHSSTSLSLAIGEAIKNKDLNKHNNIIVVIGDAAINNGLALEALNYLNEHKDLKVIIIVNDNNMSISKQSGGITKSLNSLRSKRQKALIYKITPRFMHPLWDKFKRAVRSIFYKKSLFDTFDIKYFAGIDGHDFKELYRYLSFALKYPEAIILHVNTIKGKGYRFAEDDKIGLWHNVPPFNKATGEILSSDDTVGYSLAKELVKINDERKNIKVLTAAMELGNGLMPFKEKYPNDFIDVGIAEENAVTIASSMTPDFVPFVFIYSSFMTRACDQIINEVLRENKKVIFMMDHAGIVGFDGSHHQGIFDVSLFSSFPNAKIYAPSTIEEAKMLLNLAYQNDGPTFIRYPKTLPHQDELASGRWVQLLPINDINVITYGELTNHFKEILADTNCGLINARIIKPLDTDTLNKLNNKKVIIYEEVNDHGGLFDLINHYIMVNHLNIELEQLAINNTYLEEGSIEELRTKYHLGSIELLKKIK